VAPQQDQERLPKWLADRCWVCGEFENHGWHKPQKVSGVGINPNDFHAYKPIASAQAAAVDPPPDTEPTP
jgi:hypothetical protein